AESARAVHAHAYTVGRDIVFASGRYAPQTPKGKELLAHELAHVVQQSRADGSAAPADLQLAPGGANPQQAEAEAARALVGGLGGAASSLKRQGVSIQRQEAGEEKKEQAPAAASPPKYQLQLDPAIQAQAFALQTRTLLDPTSVRLSLAKLDLGALL